MDKNGRVILGLILVLQILGKDGIVIKYPTLPSSILIDPWASTTTRNGIPKCSALGYLQLEISYLDNSDQSIELL